MAGNIMKQFNCVLSALLIICSCACSTASQEKADTARPAPDEGTISITTNTENGRVQITLKRTSTLPDTFTDRLASLSSHPWELQCMHCSLDRADLEVFRPWRSNIQSLTVENPHSFGPDILDAISSSHLEELYIRFIRIEDVSFLASFPQLKRLAIVGTRIQDDSMAHIIGLGNLNWLSLGKNHRLTGSALQALAASPAAKELRVLRIWETGIRGPDLVHLEHFPGLQKLAIAKLVLQHGQLEPLLFLQSLTHLDLGNCRIANEDLEILAALPALKNLNLSFCTLDDSALSVLGTLQTLHELFLFEAGISDGAKNRLRGMLPNCRVY